MCFIVFCFIIKKVVLVLYFLRIFKVLGVVFLFGLLLKVSVICGVLVFKLEIKFRLFDFKYDLLIILYNLLSGNFKLLIINLLFLIFSLFVIFLVFKNFLLLLCFFSWVFGVIFFKIVLNLDILWVKSLFNLKGFLFWLSK